MFYFIFKIKNKFICVQSHDIEDFKKENGELKAEIEKNSQHAEDDEKCTVPSEVISDLKAVIKELNDGNNHEYISHLTGAKDLMKRKLK